MKLAPVAPPPIPASAEKLATVPGKLKLQKGFNIELYAGNVPNARSMRQGDKGTVFVGSRLQDKVHCHRREGRQARGEGDRLGPLSAERARLHRTARSTSPSCRRSPRSRRSRTISTIRPKPTVIYRRSAEGRGARLEIHRHRTGQQALHSDRHSRATTACRPTRTRRSAASISTAAAWKSSRRACATRSASTGIRCRRSCTSPTTAATGRRRDLPEDELNRVTKVGQHFGSPFCYQGDFLDPEFGWGQSCSEFEKPVLEDRSALGLARHALLHRRQVPARSTRTRSSSRATAPAESDRRSSAATSLAVFLNHGRHREGAPKCSSRASSRTTATSAARSTSLFLKDWLDADLRRLTTARSGA